MATPVPLDCDPGHAAAVAILLAAAQPDQACPPGCPPGVPVSG